STTPVPPDASVIAAPVLAISVSRSKPLISTFSLHVPETNSVFGPAGLSVLRATFIVDNPSLAPHLTVRFTPCALTGNKNRNPTAVGNNPSSFILTRISFLQVEAAQFNSS